MDHMLSSPSFPTMGTPMHTMEENQMIDPQAQAKQEQGDNQNRFFGGMTPQNMLGSGQTPHSLLASPAPGHAGRDEKTSKSHVYAPVASPAPPSPMPPTPMAIPSIAPPPSMDPGIVPQLQNIVSTVSLGCPLDLKKIALHARNAEFNPKRFAAVIMRIRDPRTTALIFR